MYMNNWMLCMLYHNFVNIDFDGDMGRLCNEVLDV